MSKSMLVISFIAVTLVCYPATAADWYVPYTAETIQEAMDLATAGDSIWIADGTYIECDIVVTDGVTVAPMMGDASTVTVNAQGNGRVFLLQGLTQTTTISNITITGGSVPDDFYSRGGGVYIDQCSDVVVDGCMIEANGAQQGGGIGVWDSSVLISGCTLSHNGSTWGGGFDIRYSTVDFVRCTIVENTGGNGAAGWIYDCIATMQNSIVALHAAYGLYQSSGDVIQLSCTNLFNEAYVGPIADQIGVRGNISEDPLFCGGDSIGSPYCLSDESPCIATNDGCGQMGAHWIGCSAVAVDDDTPLRTAITRCYPNPFNPRVTVEYTVAASGLVELAIYSVDGRRVRQLEVDDIAPGGHTVTWDGRDDTGSAVPAGTYFCRLTTAGGSRTAKMVLVR